MWPIATSAFSKSPTHSIRGSPPRNAGGDYLNGSSVISYSQASGQGCSFASDIVSLRSPISAGSAFSKEVLLFINSKTYLFPLISFEKLSENWIFS